MKKMLLLLAALVIDVSQASAQAPYFQGKTIRFVVGYPAGSTHDLWARLVGPYMTKYIPGNPTTIVQNIRVRARQRQQIMYTALRNRTV